MAQQMINVGAAAGDGTGDKLRDGGMKINANFTEVYADLDELLAGTVLGIASADPINSGFDGLTSYGRNVFTYAEAGAGTNNARIDIPDRPEGSNLTVLYLPSGHSGGTPFVRTWHTDGSLSAANAFANATEPQLLTVTVPAGKTAKELWFGITGVTSGTALLQVEDGELAAAQTAALRESPFRGAIFALFRLLRGLLGGALISDQRAKEWGTARNFRSWDITARTAGVVSAANIVWHDGSPGVYAATVNATYGAVDSYTVTHALSGKTFTQPALTRDSSGQVTNRPAGTFA